jgi:hypothetical protein
MPDDPNIVETPSSSMLEGKPCGVLGREGSGGALYRIRVLQGTSCWTGILVKDGSEGGMPHDLRGCVHRWQWSLTSLL